MNNKLYVGNLSYSLTEQNLQQAFAEFGGVVSALIMTDRDSGQSKGFGFVEMSSSEEAQAAVQGLHGQSAGGRDLRVSIARPMEKRDAGFGGVRGGRFGY